MSLKNDILQALEENRGSDISGQALAERFNVSRNAVWKAINSLKEEGHRIKAGSNRGYSLEADSDVLSESEIRSLLPTELQTMRVLIYKEIDSTNSEAKRLVAGGMKAEALIASEYQTGGRGRLGRSFYSPEQTGLYMTLVLHPNIDLADSVYITTCTAVAVAEAIEEIAGRTTQIKWVNDIYIEGRKVCGILTEAVTNFETGILESVIIGIGINVSTSTFPDEIAERAGSISDSGILRNRLAARVAENCIRLLDTGSSYEYLTEYRRRSIVIGRELTYIEKEQEHRALCTGIDERGGLIVETDGEQRILRSGEISIRL